MSKKMLGLCFAVFLAINIYGCVALVAGAAGGAGTAVWLSGKLSEQVNVPSERAVKASRSALRSLRLEITKETSEKNVTQIMGKYSDGKTVWIDIHRISEMSSRIEVRVGAMGSDREAADKILKRIEKYL